MSRDPVASPAAACASASRISTGAGPAVGQQPKDGGEEARRRGGRERAQLGGRRVEHGDRLLVTRAGGLLDVVGALDHARAAARQRAVGATVRAEPPAARRRLVDRVPHDGVPEREAARRAAGPHQRLESSTSSAASASRLVQLGDLRGDAGLERVADDGGASSSRRAPRGSSPISAASAAATAGGTEPSLSSCPSAARPRASCSR